MASYWNHPTILIKGETNLSNNKHYEVNFEVENCLTSKGEAEKQVEPSKEAANKTIPLAREIPGPDISLPNRALGSNRKIWTQAESYSEQDSSMSSDEDDEYHKPEITASQAHAQLMQMSGYYANWQSFVVEAAISEEEKRRKLAHALVQREMELEDPNPPGFTPPSSPLPSQTMPASNPHYYGQKDGSNSNYYTQPTYYGQAFNPNAIPSSSNQVPIATSISAPAAPGQPDYKSAPIRYDPSEATADPSTSLNSRLPFLPPPSLLPPAPPPNHQFCGYATNPYDLSYQHEQSWYNSFHYQQPPSTKIYVPDLPEEPKLLPPPLLPNRQISNNRYQTRFEKKIRYEPMNELERRTITAGYAITDPAAFIITKRESSYLKLVWFQYYDHRWESFETIQLARERDKVEKRWRRSKNERQKEVDHALFKKLKKEFRRSFRSDTSRYNKMVVDAVVENGREVEQVINCVINQVIDGRIPALPQLPNHLKPAASSAAAAEEKTKVPDNAPHIKLVWRASDDFGSGAKRKAPDLPPILPRPQPPFQHSNPQQQINSFSTSSHNFHGGTRTHSRFNQQAPRVTASTSNIPPTVDPQWYPGTQVAHQSYPGFNPYQAPYSSYNPYSRPPAMPAPLQSYYAAMGNSYVAAPGGSAYGSSFQAQQPGYRYQNPPSSRPGRGWH